MKKILYLSLVIISCALIISGCTGPDGPNGANGPAGTTGSTNIKFFTYTVAPTQDPADWNQLGTPNATGFATNLLVSAIGADTNLVVQVYYGLPSVPGRWFAMPASQIFYSTLSPPVVQDTVDQLGFTWFTNTVSITYNMTSPINVTTILPKTNLFFIVSVIPPTYMKKHPGTNWKDANAIMRLPEVEAELQRTSVK